uniref:Uncharacterized protein n=1 Tax=Tetranychus urticae TaxID=32264 RepID=A0A158P4T7_TETUR
MFIKLLIWIFQFCLFIPKAYSFRTPKHDIAFYYKTHASVSLTNPDNHTTSYGIYVAGQTITIDIPTSVVGVPEILDWKVVNINKDRLMFVHKKKPQILIDQKEIKEIGYSGELSDSIIAFGDNEALHVPTIFNPNLIKPVPTWNYIELLYFDDENEKVSVLRSLPWLKDDDWKFIKEWKMTDYIHFDNKLYLAIKRTISNANSQSVNQEISIIRLCLDKGSELISSAVEIHFGRPEFNTNQITDLIFVIIFGSWVKEDDRYQLHTTQLRPNNTKIYHIYYFHDIFSLFEETANECASGSDNINSLRYHLRSEVGKCKTISYKSCSTKENIVPSRNVKNLTGEYTFHGLAGLTSSIHKIQFVTLPYPHSKRTILMKKTLLILTSFCEYYSLFTLERCFNLQPINWDWLFFSFQGDFYINKHPFGYHYVDKSANKNLFILIEVCLHLETCTQCIMYGLYFDCIWSNSICTHDDQPKNKATLTVDHCFKISKISPLMFNSSSPTILTIEFDQSLNFTASQEQLAIQAGDNHCTNITMNGPFINCSMDLTKSGQFKIEVSLRNDKYADAATLSSASTDKVHIFVPDSEYDFTFIVIFILFLLMSLVISSFILIVHTKYNNECFNRFKKFSRTRKANRFTGAQSAITRVRSKILSSTMNTLTDSTVTNAPSSKQVSRWSSMRSVPDHLYLSKELNSSRVDQQSTSASKSSKFHP